MNLKNIILIKLSIIISLALVSFGTNKLADTTTRKKVKTYIYNKSNSDLISNRIVKITIDNIGNIWLGTMDSGLIKFDKTNFTNYNKENSKIKGDYITDLYTDINSNVWISYSQPEKGTIKYNNEIWTEFPNEDIPELTFNGYPIVGDNDGNIYFCGIGSNEIIKYNEGITSKINTPNHKGKNILAIDFNSQGNIAIGLTNGFILKKGEEWKTLTTKNSELRLGTIRGVKFINDNELFIGYGGGFGDGGFSILKGDKWEHFNKSNSDVPDHMVRDFEVDSFGNIWMATNMGLFKMDKKGKQQAIFFEKKGLGRNTIMDIAIDNDNTIWLATTSGLVKIEQ